MNTEREALVEAIHKALLTLNEIRDWDHRGDYVHERYDEINGNGAYDLILNAAREGLAALSDAQATGEPVATILRGGTNQFGRANVLVRWENGAQKLADGEHKLYSNTNRLPVAWRRPALFADCQPVFTSSKEVAEEWEAEGHVVTPLFSQSRKKPAGFSADQVTTVIELVRNAADDASACGRRVRAEYFEGIMNKLSAPDIDHTKRMTAQKTAPTFPTGMPELPATNFSRNSGNFEKLYNAQQMIDYARQAVTRAVMPPERLTDEQIDRIAEPFGYFEYGDSEGDKRVIYARAIEIAVRKKFGVKP